MDGAFSGQDNWAKVMFVLCSLQYFGFRFRGFRPCNIKFACVYYHFLCRLLRLNFVFFLFCLSQNGVFLYSSYICRLALPNACSQCPFPTEFLSTNSHHRLSGMGVYIGGADDGDSFTIIFDLAGIFYFSCVHFLLRLANWVLYFSSPTDRLRSASVRRVIGEY